MLPLKPTITRWRTWITAANYYASHFNDTVDFIEQLPASNKKIKALKKLIDNQKFEEEIVSITNFKKLPDYITAIETRSLSMVKQLKILTEVENYIDGIHRNKLLTSLRKNPDLFRFTTNMSIEHIIKTKYAPLVSVDVERNFYVFKAFFRDNRTCMSEETIEIQMIILCNNDI